MEMEIPNIKKSGLFTGTNRGKLAREMSAAGQRLNNDRLKKRTREAAVRCMVLALVGSLVDSDPIQACVKPQTPFTCGAATRVFGTASWLIRCETALPTTRLGYPEPQKRNRNSPSRPPGGTVLRVRDRPNCGKPAAGLNKGSGATL